MSDCTITLGTYIAPGGSLIGTLTAATGSIVSCNTIPAGGVCSVTPATVTFLCPAGCVAGSAYHDLVQYSNAAAAQTFTAAGGSTCLVGVYGVQTCGYQTGCVVPITPALAGTCNSYAVAGQCVSTVGYTLVNACATPALVNGCLASGTVAFVNLCTSGIYSGTGCSAVTANGVLLNRCGVGVNCIGTVYTTYGLVERNIC